MTISWHFPDDKGVVGLPAAENLLGAITVGYGAPLPDGAVLSIDLDVLGASDQGCAVTTQLRTSLPVSHASASGLFGDGGSFKTTETREHLFGVLEFDAQADIQSTTYRAYQALLESCLAAGKPHLLRLWNFVPRITDLEKGEERYRLFNAGRYQALTETADFSQFGAPAACALGSHRGNVKIAFLAAVRPAMSIENSRQVSAYHYPKAYGLKPPIFSRAAWYTQPMGSDILFLSGTASIVGHQSLHVGNVARQTCETLKNIDAVLQEANRQAGRELWTLRDLHGQVFVRKLADLAAIRAILEAHGLLNITYLHADICRPDLLVEIEACAQRQVLPGVNEHLVNP